MGVLARRQLISAQRLVRPCLYAGNNAIVAGTTVFGTPSPEDVIAQLKASVAATQVKRTQAL